PAIAAEHAVLLEGDIDIQLLGNGQELGAQRRRIGRLSAHRELDAALALITRHALGNTLGKTIDMVYVQTVTGRNLTDPSNMLGGNPTCQQRDDMPWLALPSNPAAILLSAHWREAHLLIQLVAAEQNVFQHVRKTVLTRHFHQDAERQSVMDNSLPDIKNLDICPRQNAGDSCRQARAIGTGDVDQDNFLQGTAPVRKQSSLFYPRMPDSSQRPPSSTCGDWLYCHLFVSLPPIYRSRPF